MSNKVVDELPEYWCKCCGQKMRARHFIYRGEDKPQYNTRTGELVKQDIGRVYWRCPSFWCRLRNGAESESGMKAVRSDGKWHVYFDHSEQLG